mmetsp:Transcript_67700/g.136001  ORF Transcript_67700/g.136001 Transcript_67700/m.136001 type:complete len:81 (-) Transcript_67700:14-256(-)
MAFYKDRGAFTGQTVDLRPALSQFVDVISQWNEKDNYSGQFLLRLKQIRGSQLPAYALEAEAQKRRPRPKKKKKKKKKKY